MLTNVRPIALLVLLTVTNLIVHLNGSVIPHVHENFEISGPKIRNFTASSVLNCLQRCKRNAECKLAAVREIDSFSSKVLCVFASLHCYEDVEEKIRKASGWYVYELYERAARFYFGFNPDRCVTYNSARHLFTFRKKSCDLFCSDPEGLIHLPSRQCVTTASSGFTYLILTSPCNSMSVFEEYAGPTGITVRQKTSGHCLHPKDSSFFPQDGIEIVTWPSGCSYPFYFKHVHARGYTSFP